MDDNYDIQRLESLIESLSNRVQYLEQENRDFEDRIWMLEYPENNYE